MQTNFKYNSVLNQTSLFFSCLTSFSLSSCEVSLPLEWEVKVQLPPMGSEGESQSVCGVSSSDARNPVLTE